MLRQDDPPLLDGADDRGEVVVGDHHVGRFLRDLGPLDAHGDANVGLLERRGVVDAVSRHRDHVSVLLERVDDLQLVLGRDASEDRCFGHGPLPAHIVQAVQLAAMHRP